MQREGLHNPLVGRCIRGAVTPSRRNLLLHQSDHVIDLRGTIDGGGIDGGGDDVHLLHHLLRHRYRYTPGRRAGEKGPGAGAGGGGEGEGDIWCG